MKIISFKWLHGENDGGGYTKSYANWTTSNVLQSDVIGSLHYMNDMNHLLSVFQSRWMENTHTHLYPLRKLTCHWMKQLISTKSVSWFPIHQQNVNCLFSYCFSWANRMYNRRHQQKRDRDEVPVHAIVKLSGCIIDNWIWN